MAYECIIVETDAAVGIIRLNRPDALNALSSQVFADLDAVMDATAEDRDVRVVVLQGAGEKAFVAGADIKETAKYICPGMQRIGNGSQAQCKRIQTNRIHIRYVWKRIRYPAKRTANGA